MKILNLYCGIGGNRKLWGDEHEITAVENVPEIAKIYADFFPKDKMVIADAHQYLLEHYKEFDFIWSSPPCPSHSRFRKGFSVSNGAKPLFPDMKLYEEILFLEGYFKGKWVVENVIAWYDPLIPPQVLQRHYFWTNFIITDINIPADKLNITGKYKNDDKNTKEQIKNLEESLGFDLGGYKGDKSLYLRNCVNPYLGKHILELAINPIILQKSIF